MEHKFKLVFFTGKGGAGKTTCATAFALGVSKNKKTLIVSLDPAHNLGDVLNRNLNETPSKIANNLYASEVDFDLMTSKYLKELTGKIKDIYRYLKVLNLEKYVDVLKHSPGIEEYATLEKILEIIKLNLREGKYDIIVFDTPPTGLTLRIMALPTISTIWINKLMELRLAILNRRRMIERVIGHKIVEKISGEEYFLYSNPNEDPIFRELASIKKDISLVNKLLTDPKTTSVILVVNPEILSILEASRAYSFLEKLNIPSKYIIVNKVLKVAEEVPETIKLKLKYQEEAMDVIRKTFSKLYVLEVPLLPKEPRGIECLKIVVNFLDRLVCEFTYD